MTLLTLRNEVNDLRKLLEGAVTALSKDIQLLQIKVKALKKTAANKPGRPRKDAKSN